MHSIARCVILALSLVAMHTSARAESSAPGFAKALELAGPNRAELESALAQASPALRPHLEWLIAHMPEADLRSVKSGFLALDAQQALDAWQSAP